MSPGFGADLGVRVGTAAASLPFHGGVVVSESVSLYAVIAVAGVGAAVLLVLAIGAFARRRSRPYLLIVAALAALLGRSAVAGVSLTGLVSVPEHHFLEHGLDLVLVSLVITAIIHSRTAVQEASIGP